MVKLSDADRGIAEVEGFNEFGSTDAILTRIISFLLPLRHVRIAINIVFVLTDDS